MPRHHAQRFDEPAIDSKTRRKLEDQRRMQFRRAIEDRAEQRRLLAELNDYPDLIAINYLLSSTAERRRTAAKAC
ncbi:PA3496 family putative envelope integrity protein [Pseudomonas solani]|uniref:PA3496 family putative envelope integrity protein n=1 Tax=Pseudomonas TaxID=286 RepID=UPI0021DF9810|nr:transcriptional regulator [Pseudomonas sp. PDM13]MCU9950761.1 transcriptional regulator [Pseudomonas sp. PDM13]